MMDHASMALLIPFAPFVMVVAIVAVTTLGKVARHYMDWRLEMARRLGTGDEANLTATLQALRAEIAALKQRESEVILTFDSTLQRLDDRLKHLEARSLGASTAARPLIGAEPPAAREETAATTMPR
jgi:glucose-6-phosphate isomerase